MSYFEVCAADKVPLDVVVVNIWRSLGRTVADISCTARGANEGPMIAEFPRPVPVALERAEQVREHRGLSRVVIVLADASLWRPDWGTLKPLVTLH